MGGRRPSRERAHHPDVARRRCSVGHLAGDGGRRVPNRKTAERSPSPLRVWPTVTATTGLMGPLLLLRVRPDDGSLPSWLWYGDPSTARSVLQVMATSVMTATTLTFSLTVVALQLASQQFSPRLLREFGRDPVTKVGGIVFVTLSHAVQAKES